MGIADGDFVVALVGHHAVHLVFERAIAQLHLASEPGVPTQACRRAAPAHGVTEDALVAEPVADDQPVVGHAVLPDRVYVPGVLPLRGLECQVEALGEAWKMDAPR